MELTKKKVGRLTTRYYARNGDLYATIHKVSGEKRYVLEFASQPNVNAGESNNRKALGFIIESKYNEHLEQLYLSKYNLASEYFRLLDIKWHTASCENDARIAELQHQMELIDIERCEDLLLVEVLKAKHGMRPSPSESELMELAALPLKR